MSLIFCQGVQLPIAKLLPNSATPASGLASQYLKLPAMGTTPMARLRRRRVWECQVGMSCFRFVDGKARLNNLSELLNTQFTILQKDGEVVLVLIPTVNVMKGIESLGVMFDLEKNVCIMQRQSGTRASDGLHASTLEFTSAPPRAPVQLFLSSKSGLGYLAVTLSADPKKVEDTQSAISV